MADRSTAGPLGVESRGAAGAFGAGAAPGSGQGERIYDNAGNPALLALLAPGARRVLDVGCGTGANAALLRARDPGSTIEGITFSAAEAELARRHLDRVWVLDLEQSLPPELAAARFDALICSHVLEHLREPSAVLGRLARLLRAGGSVLIAVPNVLCWQQRLAFLAGRFEYRSHGVLDGTHLRFFTYDTADRYLLAEAPELRLVAKHVTGSVPLWWLRRRVLPRGWSAGIDALGCRARPNLFGSEVLLRAEKS